MSKYFRATGYYPKEDIGFIIDSNGKFTERWQLGSMLACANCEVIAISDYDKVQEINITKASTNTDCCIIRAVAKGKPSKTQNGASRTLTVGNKTYKTS